MQVTQMNLFLTKESNRYKQESRLNDAGTVKTLHMNILRKHTSPRFLNMPIPSNLYGKSKHISLISICIASKVKKIYTH